MMKNFGVLRKWLCNVGPIIIIKIRGRLKENKYEVGSIIGGKLLVGFINKIKKRKRWH